MRLGVASRAARQPRPGPVIASMRRTLAALELSLSELEDADLGGRCAHACRRTARASTSAVADLHHPHDVAVLLAEQRHRAERARLVERRRDRADGSLRRIHSLTRSSICLQVLGRDPLAVVEVEAQLVGADVGAGLAHVRAERLAQRGVQQVRRGVVGLRRGARSAVDARDDPLARAAVRPASTCDDDGLVVADAHDVGDVPAGVAGLGLQHARVGDLAAARRVERRLGEVDEHAVAPDAASAPTVVCCSSVS